MTHFLSDYVQGMKDERERIIELLREKRALRDSICDDELVLYTQDGPIDITHKELEDRDV